MAIFGDFLRRVFSASRVQHVSDLHSKFAHKIVFGEYDLKREQAHREPQKAFPCAETSLIQVLARSCAAGFPQRAPVREAITVLFSVAQGSVLGPILFLLYTAGLFNVTAECGLTAHSYADDTQVYISTPASDHSDAMRRLSECIRRIRDWMVCNRLKLNEDKTQAIWLGLGNTSSAQ